MCVSCGRPMAATTGLRLAARCTSCAAEPLRLDGLRAATLFDGVIRRAIHQFKYDGYKALAPYLAGLMLETWGEGLFPVDCIIPVPLHPRRLRDRGYNQAALIAEEIACAIDLPEIKGTLVRSRMTESQVNLNAAARRRNVAGAFKADGADLAARSVLLLDDVCTTGSTLQACADALREARVAYVYAFTLSRAVYDPVTGALGDASAWSNQIELDTIY